MKSGCRIVSFQRQKSAQVGDACGLVRLSGFQDGFGRFGFSVGDQRFQIIEQVVARQLFPVEILLEAVQQRPGVADGAQHFGVLCLQRRVLRVEPLRLAVAEERRGVVALRFENGAQHAIGRRVGRVFSDDRGEPGQRAPVVSLFECAGSFGEFCRVPPAGDGEPDDDGEAECGECCDGARQEKLCFFHAVLFRRW